jgi:Protein of unknown function (DUF3443)
MSGRLQSAWLALLAAAVVGLAACGGGGGNSTSSPAPPVCNSEAVLGTAQTASSNVAPLTVDGGPVISNGSGGAMLAGTINQAYTTVTVCDPNNPSSCQTIDHVWVDTGSYGLRLMCTPFMAKLQASQQSSTTVGNCGQFVSSYTWGAVRTAIVKIAGESTASSIPIQVIADAGVPSTAPSSCSNGATAQNTVKDLGANGILGIGVFKEDCGLGCEANSPPPTGWYYTCPGGTCSAVNVTTAAQLQNPVGHFATDNNGTLIQMTPVPSAGAATGSGSLIFGIGTQANNPLGTANVFGASATTANMTPAGDIQTSTTFAGGDTTEPASYIDSGSNAYFFNDSNLTQCTGASAGLFCPKSTETTSLAATMLPYNTPTDTTSVMYNFSVADISSSPNLAFNNVGGPSGTCNNTSIPCTFAWGMSFFYGRSVFTALEGATVSGTTVATPFFATSP